MNDTTSNSPFHIRPATRSDSATIVTLIRELAVYERLDHHAQATPQDIETHLFGPRPYAEALIADVEGTPVGFALFFHTFSTFRGRPGLYLEDVFVRPDHRAQGIGKALFTRVAQLAVARGCQRLEWAVLNWNSPAIGFYHSLGARPLDDWTTYRLDDQALANLGSPT